MAGVKAQQNYVATTGIDFESVKPKVRVEAGEAIPASLKVDQIRDLLDIGAIRLAEKEKEN